MELWQTGTTSLQLCGQRTNSPPWCSFRKVLRAGLLWFWLELCALLWTDRCGQIPGALISPGWVTHWKQAESIRGIQRLEPACLSWEEL